MKKIIQLFVVLLCASVINMAQETTEFSAILQSEKQFHRPIISYPGEFTVDQWIENTTEYYNYSTQLIEVTVEGMYQIEVVSVEGFDDPMLFVYGENFDPDSPISDGIIANDDTDGGLLSAINNNFQVGVYTLIVTSYSQGDTGTVYYEVNGPAMVNVSENTTPTVQASNIIFANVQDLQMDISFTKGNGIKRAVFMKEGGRIKKAVFMKEAGEISNPVDKTTYTASTDWTVKGSELGTSGYYCVFNGSSESFTVTNLTFEAEYIVQVFEYNGSEGFEEYLTTTASGNPSNQIALPVELTSFSANIADETVSLNWTTETEINNYGFEIERLRKPQITNNEIQNWEKLGFIQGFGNSNSEKNYTFSDELSESGNYSYRLKQIDNDGKYEYSDVVEINYKKSLEFSLDQNYPNPFNPTTKINFNLPQSGYVTLKIYDLLGNEVADLINEFKNEGRHSVEFNAGKISSGIYFYELRTDNFSAYKKMTILK